MYRKQKEIYLDFTMNLDTPNVVDLVFLINKGSYRFFKFLKEMQSKLNYFDAKLRIRVFYQ